MPSLEGIQRQLQRWLRMRRDHCCPDGNVTTRGESIREDSNVTENALSSNEWVEQVNSIFALDEKSGNTHLQVFSRRDDS